MAYRSDGTRLFSCGTNKEGESFIVEWNESEGAVKRTYNGLGKRAVLTTIDSEGCFMASPCIWFNKEGILLAVSTNDNEIKILANQDGVRLLRMDNHSFDPSRIPSTSAMKQRTSMMPTFDAGNATGGGPSMLERVPQMPSMVMMSGENRNLEALEKSRILKVTEIFEPSQCRSSRLPDDTASAMWVLLLGLYYEIATYFRFFFLNWTLCFEKNISSYSSENCFIFGWIMF